MSFFKVGYCLHKNTHIKINAAKCIPQWCKSTHTHTHARLTARCPGLPGWASTRKVKPTWILLKQGTVSGNGISWAICKSAPHSRQITMPAPHHSVFLQAGCPSCHPTNSVKALKAIKALKACLQCFDGNDAKAMQYEMLPEYWYIADCSYLKYEATNTWTARRQTSSCWTSLFSGFTPICLQESRYAVSSSIVEHNATTTVQLPSHATKICYWYCFQIIFCSTSTIN